MVALGCTAFAEKGLVANKNCYRIGLLCKDYGQLTDNSDLDKMGNVALLFQVTGIKDVFADWYENNRATAARIDMKNLNYADIPVSHHNNPIFIQHLCPITLCPMRFPVTAPNLIGGPNHHFERKAIVQWLFANNTNPVNHEPLHLSDLIENSHIRQIMENEMTNLGIPL